MSMKLVGLKDMPKPRQLLQLSLACGTLSKSKPQGLFFSYSAIIWR